MRGIHQWWFPSQRVSNVESIYMSWHHHVYRSMCLFCGSYWHHWYKLFSTTLPMSWRLNTVTNPNRNDFIITNKSMHCLDIVEVSYQSYIDGFYTRLLYLQCLSNGDTAVLYWVIDIFACLVLYSRQARQYSSCIGITCICVYSHVVNLSVGSSTTESYLLSCREFSSHIMKS